MRPSGHSSPGTRPGRDAPRILIIRPDRLGDVVLATPLVRALRDRHPRAHIAMLVRPYARAVLEGNPHLDRILVDDPGGEDRGLRGFGSLVFRLRRQKFDTSLMLLPTRRHALATLFAGIPRRFGVGRKPYEVLTGSVAAGRNRDRPVRHEADYCLDLGRAIGLECDDPTPEVFLTDREKSDARLLLEAAGVGPGPVVGLHPGSGGSAPNWVPERYVDLVCRIVEERKAQVVVTGDGTEPRMDWDAVGRAGIVDLTGRLPLRELMGVLSCLDAVVSSSTGPMHLAAALGVPSIALFCPRTACCPERWGPLGNGHRVLLAGSERCERCGSVRDPECRFQQISVASVFAALCDVLAGK